MVSVQSAPPTYLLLSSVADNCGISSRDHSTVQCTFMQWGAGAVFFSILVNRHGRGFCTGLPMSGQYPILIDLGEAE